MHRALNCAKRREKQETTGGNDDSFPEMTPLTLRAGVRFEDHPAGDWVATGHSKITTHALADFASWRGF